MLLSYKNLNYNYILYSNNIKKFKEKSHFFIQISYYNQILQKSFNFAFKKNNFIILDKRKAKKKNNNSNYFQKNNIISKIA